jgi:hypothetical protein
VGDSIRSNMPYHFFSCLFAALQDTSQELRTEKALEAAVSFSQSLSQWAYIVLGGSDQPEFLYHGE